MRFPWPRKRGTWLSDGLGGSGKELIDPVSRGNGPSRRHINVNGDMQESHSPHGSSPCYQRMTPDHVPTGSTIECPTCQGKGKLSQGQADGMVALIPVKDERLRPRRTLRYIAVTILLCVVVFGSIAIFLMPRSVSLTFVSANSYNISIKANKSLVPHIDMVVELDVTNHNFLSVKLSDLDIQVTWNKGVLVVNYTAVKFSVDARSSVKKLLKVRTSFMGPQAESVRDVCLYDWKWKITDKFSASANVVYLGRGEQISASAFLFVACYGIAHPQPYTKWTK